MERTRKKITYRELVEVLYRHSLYLDRRRGGRQADLRNTDMTGINMVAAAYEATGKTAVRLQYAHLENADLSELSMKEAGLDGAFLAGARFCGTFLKGSSFAEADASGADFTKANLVNADFKDAVLKKACFDGAKVRDMGFEGALFDGAVFSAKTAGLTDLVTRGYDNEKLLHAMLDSDPRLARVLEDAGKGLEEGCRYPDGVEDHIAGCRRALIEKLEEEGLLHADIPSGTAVFMREKGRTAALDMSLLNALIPKEGRSLIVIGCSGRGVCRVDVDGKPLSRRRSREQAIADAAQLYEKRKKEGRPG